MLLRRSIAVLGVVALASVLVGAPAGAGGPDAGEDEPTLEPAPEHPKPTPAYERTIALAITDIQEFWGAEFPNVYGAPYEPVPDDRIFAAKPGIDLPDCQGEALTYEDAEDNAFYCYKGNFIAYDDVSLFPQLYRAYGEFSIALVLAHEWGHAIQDRAGNAEQLTILKELQADCFAGSWIARVDDGLSRLSIEGGSLDQGLAAMLLFRDAPGSSPDDPAAHGSGFDRVSAFQQGFDEGAVACATYFESPPTIVESAIFTSPESESRGGNLPRDEVLPAMTELLHKFYEKVEPAYARDPIKDLVDSDSENARRERVCGKLRARDVEHRVFFCPDDGGYIAYDQPYLERVYDNVGDFGVGILLAGAWAEYVETLQGRPGVPDGGLPAVLLADCYTGGFARFQFDRDRLDPGDLDETIQALVEESVASGLATVDNTFVRVRAFRQGFSAGYESCNTGG